MAKIRHEIHIIDATISATGSAIVQLDTTKYNGTVTYYFETVAKVASGTLSLSLQRVTGGTNDATNSVTATTYTRQRSASFSPPAGQTQYKVALSGGTTPLVQSARIIVLQDATDITNSETQIEIGNEQTGMINTTDSPLAAPKYWYYDSANWDGTCTFYAEATFAQTAGGVVDVVLQQDNGSFASWTNVATVALNQTPASPTRSRSTAFTPVSGRHYRIAGNVASSMDTWEIYNAKIIVNQVAAFSAFATYYIDASDSGPTDNNNLFSNDANGFDGDTGTYTSISSSSSLNHLTGIGTTAPASGDSIAQVRGRGYITPNTGQGMFADFGDNAGTGLGTTSKSAGSGAGYTSYVTLTTPAAGWSWATLQSVGARYRPVGGGDATETRGHVLEIEVSTFTGTLTKIEEQYLLAHGSFGGSTGLKDYDTYYDPAEWDDGGGTTTFYHEGNGAASGTADVKLQSDPNGTPADVALSTITDTIERERTAALTMPGAAATIDTNVTGTGSLYASRMVVSYVHASGGTAALTGTITSSVTEADIVAGGKTIILTLTGDTFVAAGTGPIGTTANTQALIDGIDSAQAEAAGWNAVVQPGIETTDVVRTSDTVATITLDAEATYDISATETITATIPAEVLTGAVAIIATPTFQITADASATTTPVPTLSLMGVGH